MPQMTVRGPDGQNYQFPPDATDAEIIEFFQRQTPPTSTPQRTTPSVPLGPMVPFDLDVAQDLATGIGKSVVGAIEGGGQLLRQIPGVERLSRAIGEVTVPVSSRPSNPTQTVGKVLGDTAMFFAPAGVVGKTTTALKTGRRLADLATTMAAEGAAAGTVGAMQSGDVGTGAMTGVVTAGMVPGGAALGRGLRWMGERVERALVKATKADIEDGFSAAKVFKYDVGGSLNQTLDKTKAKITTLVDQLRQALTTVKPGGQRQQVDVLDALARTAQDFAKNAPRHYGEHGAIQRAIAHLMDELEPSLASLDDVARATGRVDLEAANSIKQAVGEMGAWLHDSSGRAILDPDAKAMEKVANAFYGHLKRAIEQNAVGPVKHINQQLADLIAIRNAVIRRIPVESRQNVVNLGDMIGFGTGQWGIALANRVLRSGQAANAMVKTGEQMTGTMPARVSGAVMGQVAQ